MNNFEIKKAETLDELHELCVTYNNHFLELAHVRNETIKQILINELDDGFIHCIQLSDCIENGTYKLYSISYEPTYIHFIRLEEYTNIVYDKRGIDSYLKANQLWANKEKFYNLYKFELVDNGYNQLTPEQIKTLIDMGILFETRLNRVVKMWDNYDTKNKNCVYLELNQLEKIPFLIRPDYRKIVMLQNSGIIEFSLKEKELIFFAKKYGDKKDYNLTQVNWVLGFRDVLPELGNEYFTRDHSSKQEYLENFLKLKIQSDSCWGAEINWLTGDSFLMKIIPNWDNT